MSENVSAAYLLGQEAYWDEKELNDNPFDKNSALTNDYQEWSNGWKDAEAEIHQ